MYHRRLRAPHPLYMHMLYEDSKMMRKSSLTRCAKSKSSTQEAESSNTLRQSTKKFVNQSRSPHLEHSILKKFREFHKFGWLVDADSDHRFVANNSSEASYSEKWIVAIQRDRKILANRLPDSIFVRVYKRRMDLMRAAIVGVEGTPYQNSLFFFDIYFPPDYPYLPPLVYSPSLVERLNPVFGQHNLSLLSFTRLTTWPGSEKFCWYPCESTVLDILVGIQSLVLNAKPFFNHPPQEPARNNIEGADGLSLLYNENVFSFLLSWMSHTMRKPPKHFEDLVIGHFVSRAHHIMGACKAYTEGAHVGSLFQDGVRAGLVEKSLRDRWHLRTSAYCVRLVCVMMNNIFIELTKIGAMDCDQFLSPEIIKEGLTEYEFQEKFNYVKF